MKGATYWMAVGRLEIGVFIDAAGKSLITMRGETSIDNVKAIHTAIEAVVGCAMHNAKHESDDTGRMHSEMIR